MALPEKPQDVESRAHYEREELLAISRALSSERDIHKLLDMILRKSRQITGADAGSVYVVESVEESPKDRAQSHRRAALGEARGAASRLHFMLSQNDSMAVNFDEFTLKLDESSVAGKAVLSRQPINSRNLGAEPTDTLGTGHDRSFDQQTGYQARSMLTVPMLSAMGDVIGVIQLINKKRTAGAKLADQEDFAREVVPFDERAEEMALALASQAGVSLENAILYDEIRRLFEGFVDASVTAIEARDPTTSGHSRRVATLTVALAEKVDAISDGPFGDVRFSRDDLRQIEYAGVLHDFGKVGVREQVLVKAKKLYEWQLAAIGQRFRYLRKSFAAEAMARKIELFERGERPGSPSFSQIDVELAAQLAFLDRGWRSVDAANQPSLVDQPVLEHLADLASGRYLDDDGVLQPYLTQEELSALQVPRGSLTAEERLQIQSHVDHTIAFLRTIPWGRALGNVPRIAGAHHELLDGSGYPQSLRGEEICIESRMLTIADIFDAITASDRPYKAAVPVVRALDILSAEVKAGKCDAHLFRIFVEAEIYKAVLA